jgi:hypothetical protein
MIDSAQGVADGVAAHEAAAGERKIIPEAAPREAAPVGGNPVVNEAAAVGGDAVVGGGDARAPSIAGISALKGLILYGATLTFAGLYAYFITRILGAKPGHPPGLDTAMVSTAAALAGVLGSAFALEIGTPPDESKTNPGLAKALLDARNSAAMSTHRAKAKIRQLLSLEPGDTQTASWPKTFGIWVFAIVATAVALTYILNQTETPGTIKALAVAFAGYVIALINGAYNLSKKSAS